MRSLGALLASTILVLGAPAQATSVLFVDIPDMAALSSRVVDARVEGVTPVDLRDEGQGLFTDVRLRVLDVLKGDDVPSRFVMRLVGGAGRDGLALTIPGMPKFKRGERVVLFLETTNTGFVPCGLGQGVWRIHETSDRPWAVQQVDGVHLMARDATGSLHTVEPEPLSWGLTLDRLVADVLTAIDRPVSGPEAGAQDPAEGPHTAAPAQDAPQSPGPAAPADRNPAPASPPPAAPERR